MAVPHVDAFKEAVDRCRGNLSKVARLFGVERCTVYTWISKNKKFREAVNDARSRLFDDCLTTAEAVAIGIPERDSENKLIGWKERPDGNMLRYLLSTLGRKEGFGESLDITSNGKSIGTQLIFGNTRLTERDIEDIKRIQSGKNKDSPDPGIPET
jgi:transposase-like protein